MSDLGVLLVALVAFVAGIGAGVVASAALLSRDMTRAWPEEDANDV